MKTGKKYAEKAKLVDRNALYIIEEAVELLKKTAPAKFDETIDLSIRLGIDPKKTDQNVRGTVALPGGTGKKVTLAVLAKGEKYKEAQEAGADHVGMDDLVEKIMGGWTEFDLLLATPDVMASVGKLGKVLGKKGLMPNPKAGTVTNDISKAVKDFKAGKVEFKPDKSAVIHLGIGKVSFDAKAIASNIMAVLEGVNKARPSAFKGLYFKSAYISSTMGPSIKLNVQKALKNAQEAD
ncbi:MAG: 50S ribosomal protein L1 [Candidatus Margulisiibacteriota bacterium]